MTDFAPGDLVVCVDAGPNVRIAKGRHYVVVEVLQAPSGWEDAGEWGIVVRGIHSGSECGGYLARRFRKIDKADEGFSAWMKALRPIKHKAPQDA